MWLVAGIAAVVGGVAVLVASFAESEHRVAPSRVGDVTPEQLRSARIPLTWRGYDPGHVDALLARAASAIEDAQRHGPARAAQGRIPDFIAATFADDEAEDDPGAGAPVWDRPEDVSLGEELEDGGGDGAGGLDR